MALFEQWEKSKDNPAIASVLQAFEFVGHALALSSIANPKYAAITVDALKTAWEQPNPLERLAFFQGLTEGMSKPGLPGRPTVATSIYNRLYLHRKEIVKLNSVRELRGFLLARGLSEQVLGRHKRLEKLCERIGLSFA